MTLESARPIREVAPPKGFPSSLRIFSQVWEVKYCVGLMTGRHTFGETHEDKRLIVLDVEVAREQLVSVLMHEALHAGLSTLRLEWLDHEHEEELVRLMTPINLSLLRDNKAWWA